MGRFFPQNALVIHFSYECRTFFIHSKIHSIVRQKYSFREFIHSIVRQKYSFKDFIHSKNNLIIHSMKILIFLKNAVSPTPISISRNYSLFSLSSWKSKFSCIYHHYHHQNCFLSYPQNIVFDVQKKERTKLSKLGGMGFH